MRRRVWFGFAGLCLLGGSRWLLDEAVTPPLPPMPRVALHSALLLAVFGMAASLRKGRETCAAAPTLLRVALFGAAVFVAPEAVAAGAGGRVSGLTAALIFTLVPVVVVCAVAQQDAGFGVARADPRSLLGPALVGVFGDCLVLPFTTPASIAGKFWLLALTASVVLSGVAAVRLHALLRGVPLFLAAAAVAAGMAVVAAACSGAGLRALATMDGRTAAMELLITVAFDGPLLLLGLDLVREMPPVGFATRVPLFLLVSVVESYGLLRPAVGWPMGAGVLLIAGSAAWLLRTSAHAPTRSE